MPESIAVTPQDWSLLCPIYLPPQPPVGILYSAPVHPTHPLLPLLPSMFLCSRLTHIGALVIIYLTWPSSPLAVTYSKPTRTLTDLVDFAFFSTHPYTHCSSFGHGRPADPPDGIISVRTRPSRARRSALQPGHPSWGNHFCQTLRPARGLPFFRGLQQVIRFTQSSGPRRRPRGVMLFCVPGAAPTVKHRHLRRIERPNQKYCNGSALRLFINLLKMFAP